MAILDLYMTPNGDDRNAGTDSTATPTEIQGSVSTTSGLTTFTASSGTPFASGISAGSWVSFYIAGELVSRFTGQVQSVTSSTIIVVYNQAATSPNNTALGTVSGLTGTVACRVGGPWKSLAIVGTNGVMNSPATSAALTGTQYAGLRINIQAGTYANSAQVTLPIGLAAKPICWRGYYSTLTGTAGTIGYASDIDNCANINGTLTAPTGQSAAPVGATRPQITSTATANLFLLSGWNWLENLEFSGTPAGGNTVIGSTGTNAYNRLVRCRATASATSNNAFACTNSYGTTLHATGCLINNAGIGSSSAAFLNQGYCNLLGNATRGGVAAMNVGGQGTIASFNLIEGGGTGISISGTNANNSSYLNNVIYNCTTGVSVAAATTGHVVAANNLISNCTTGVVYSSSVNAWTMQLINNGFYSISSTQLSGCWESWQRGAITESSPGPFTAAASHDFSLTNTAQSRQNGFPGQFEV